MQAGRMPVQISSNPSTNFHNLNSQRQSNEGIITHEHVRSQLPWPNYCSHRPAYPEFFVIPKLHKSPSKLILEVLKQLECAYFNPQKMLSTLQNHTTTTGNQVKSQRRNAVIALSQVMFYYSDHATGRIGRLQSNGRFEDLSLYKLGKLAGLTSKRTKRAMKDIIKSGYLYVVRQWKKDHKGKIFALPSIKEFTPKFFIDLDIKGVLWQKWVSLKNWKKAQAQKKENKMDKKKAEAVKALISETAKYAPKKKIGEKKKPSNINSSPSTMQTCERILKKYLSPP